MSNKTEIIILAIMCFVLSIAIAIQVNTVNNNGSTTGSSQAENNLKAQVLSMKEKYEQEYTKLENLTQELEEVRLQQSSRSEELKKLEEKIKQDNLLLGNTDVKGQGVIITLNDGKALDEMKPADLLIHDSNVLFVINELKNAGASAISINDERVVNKTAISCDGNVIVVNGEKIGTPIVISAIGLQERFLTLDRPGGTLESIRYPNKTAELKKAKNVLIPKYTGVYTFKYAKTVD